MGSGAGYLYLSVTGADLSATLEALTNAGVMLMQIRQKDDLTVTCYIPRQNYSTVERIFAKRADEVRILGRGGFWYLAHSLLHRPVLILGLVLLTAATLYLPGRIFFVEVEGNRALPARQILEAAQQCGITFGASRRDVRSEKMKNQLLDLIPQLQWAGVNTRGCVAVITVRERMPEETVQESSGFGHIVALRDGVITTCTAYAGSLLCSPGQAVIQGDILISGYTDCGLSIRAEQARGEVYAQTSRRQTARIPLIRKIQSETGKFVKKISLIVGKKRINLWKDSGIWDTTCDRMYEEYYVTLPGGFQLPLALAVETFALCRISDQTLPDACAQAILQESCASCLHDQMIAGTILKSELDYFQEDGCMQLYGQYVCTEMIGIMQRQQIGEKNGKSD